MTRQALRRKRETKDIAVIYRSYYCVQLEKKTILSDSLLSKRFACAIYTDIHTCLLNFLYPVSRSVIKTSHYWLKLWSLRGPIRKNETAKVGIQVGLNATVKLAGQYWLLMLGEKKVILK